MSARSVPGSCWSENENTDIREDTEKFVYKITYDNRILAPCNSWQWISCCKASQCGSLTFRLDNIHFLVWALFEGRCKWFRMLWIGVSRWWRIRCCRRISYYVWRNAHLAATSIATLVIVATIGIAVAFTIASRVICQVRTFARFIGCENSRNTFNNFDSNRNWDEWMTLTLATNGSKSWS